MRRLFNAVAQELQGNLVPRQQNGRETSYGAYGGFGSFGGYGNGALGGLIGSLSQQPRPSNVPCPRKTPQAGHLDWIGLIDPRFSYFNVCPTCYNTQIRPTPFAGAFSTKPAAPPHLVLRCDMSRFWVRMAGLVLLTMNQDRRHDVTLLSRVSGISVQEGPCPNTHLDNEHAHQSRITRLWYSIRDPTTGGIPLPGWTICSHCVVSIQTMSPAIASAFVPTSQVPTEGSCALIPSDSFDDAYSAQQLQYIATCAVYSSQAGRPNMTPLITWLKENPPPTRGAVPGRSWEAPAGPCPRDYASVTVKCYVMGEIPDFTVCEKCFAEVVKPDMDRGAELARRFGTEARAVPTGFTCQLYSNRMRHVWSQTVSSGNVEILRQKVSERRIKEAEYQLKITALKQQEKQLQEQAKLQEHLAANALRVEANRASVNIMVNTVGGGHRIDPFTVEYQNSSADFTPTNRMNNQAAMLRMQAGQVQGQVRLAEEEWKRYWE